MTKQDLFDWCSSHKCDIVPIENSRVGTVRIVNEKNDSDVPTDIVGMDKLVSDNYVCLICTRLGLPVPKYGETAQKNIEKLK